MFEYVIIRSCQLPSKSTCLWPVYHIYHMSNISLYMFKWAVLSTANLFERRLSVSSLSQQYRLSS